MGVDMGKIVGPLQMIGGAGLAATGNPAGIPMLTSGITGTASAFGGPQAGQIASLGTAAQYGPQAGAIGTPPQQGPLAGPMSQVGGALSQAGPAMAALGLGGGHPQQGAPQTPPPPAMAQRPMPTGSTAGGAMPMPSPNPMPKPPSMGPMGSSPARQLLQSLGLG